MAYVILLLLLIGVVWFVSAPLRHAAATPFEDRGWEPMRRIDLHAARDAKYREIRDAELDHQTGKLSDADHEAIDSTLRAEAIELLHQLDAIDDEKASGEGEALDSE
jgi:hypothetical protein